MNLLDSGRTAGVKLGPALPHSLIPTAVEAEWITHRGETVEVTLWAGAGASPGRRSALIMPNARLTATAPPPLPVRDLGRYLYEPARVVVGDLWSRRLFQTRSSEEHLSGSLAELGPCLPAEPGLGESSRSNVGTEPRAHPSGGC